jgi:hypothetical protein
LENICFLLVFKDALFKQILANLLMQMNNNHSIFESAAEDMDGLLKDIVNFKPDTLLLEEASYFSSKSSLAPLLMAMPGRPIVVVSQKYNLMHVVHYRTVQVETVGDLIESLKLY